MGSVWSGLTSVVSIRIARLNWFAGTASPGLFASLKSYSRRQSAIQVLGQARAAGEVAAARREQEQQLERAAAEVEDRVPVVLAAGSSSDRAGRRRSRTRSAWSGRRSRARPPRTALRPPLKTLWTHAGLADPRQVVGANHPLVVLRHDLARLLEPLCRGRGRREACRRTRLWKRIIARCVWATARFSSLRGSGMTALRFFAAVLPTAGQVEAGLRRAGRASASVVPIFRWRSSLVELRRLRVARAGSVERVEVEARRAPLEQCRGGDVLAEHDRRLVEGQVVIDELAEVGEARRDPGRPAASRGHLVRDLLANPLAGLVAAPVGPMREKRNAGVASAAAALAPRSLSRRPVRCRHALRRSL